MNRRTEVTVCVMLVALGLALSLLPGCAAKKAAPPGTEAIAMVYNLAKAKPVVYRNVQTASQTMEIMSQYVNIETTRQLTYTLTPGAVENGNQRLTVTIDSLEAGMTTPQGDFTADPAAALGKSFEMTLSATGKELDITGADLIQYAVGAAGQRSVKPDFQAIFPDLPGNPVKIGDTWTTADTLDVDESGMKLKLATTYVNTFEGVETLDGVECARIRSATTGTVTGEGEQQGAPVVVDSKMEGTDLWFFAYKQGMLAKLTSELSMNGNVTVGGAQGMVIPMKQQMKTETFWVK